jgi:transcriptional regulator with XRE-family HTH domain
MVGNIIPFRHAPAPSTDQRSGRSSVRGTPVSRSIGSTNSAGTPLLERTSQYQTCDCVVPIRSASCFWPPAALHARRSASFDMPAQYPNLGKAQQKNLCRTGYLTFGNWAGMRTVDPKALGARLFARREGRGHTQDSLARAIGMKQQGVDNIEKGKVRRPRLIREIAAELGTSQEWLLWAEGPEAVDDTQLIEIMELLRAATPGKRRAVIRILRHPAGRARRKIA